MAVPRYLAVSGAMANPGDGDFAMWTVDPVIPRFQSITITQADPAIPITGVLTFSLGPYTSTIDLGAGVRFLATQRVPMLFMNITGSTRSDQWAIVLS